MEEHFERCYKYMCTRINKEGNFNLWTNNPSMIERRNNFQKNYLNKEYTKEIYVKEWNRINENKLIEKIKNYYEDY